MKKQKKFKQTLKDEELLGICNNYKDTAIDNYTHKYKHLLNAYRQAFNGKIDTVDERKYRLPRGYYTSRDIAITINTIIPDITKLVFTDEPVSITARTEEDVPKAEKMQILLNYQITQLNEYAKTMEHTAIESLITGIGILKCIWCKETKIKEFEEVLTYNEVQELENAGFKVEALASGDINELGETLYNCKYEAEVTVKNQPVYENVPAHEVLFDPIARSVEECNYIVHRRLVTVDWLRREELAGRLKNVSELIEEAEASGSYHDYSYDLDDDKEQRYIYKAENKENKPLNSIMIYELWGKIDINQDGYLEDVIITFAKDYILSVQENTYDMYPFFIFNPLYNTQDIVGISMGELAFDNQMLKTTLIREMIDNTRMNNNRKMFYNLDSLVDPSQMSSSEQYVAVKDGVNPAQVFAPEPYEPFSPNTQNLLGYIDRENQKVTGISDIKQGVRATGDQTATEATIKYEASNSQIQTIAVHFAEPMKQLYKFVMYQNQQFIDESVTIRLFNDTIEVNPEDIKDVDFDLKVSVSLGSGTQETRNRNLNTALQMMLQVAMPMGITDKNKIRNIMSKILENIGLKDVDSYLYSEQELQQQEQQAMQQQQMAMEQQAMQQQAMQQQAMGMPQGAPPEVMPEAQGLPLGDIASKELLSGEY